MSALPYLRTNRRFLIPVASAFCLGGVIGCLAGIANGLGGFPPGKLVSLGSGALAFGAACGLGLHARGVVRALASGIRSLESAAGPGTMGSVREPEAASLRPATVGATAARTTEFRTANGFTYRAYALPDIDVVDSTAVRRGFEIASPTGLTCSCTVELAPRLVTQLSEAAGPASGPTPSLWDGFCRSALSQHLGESGGLPPHVLHIEDLSGMGHGALRMLKLQRHRCSVA